ncbi:MAG: DUF4143 domain-containing protein [Propionibacteriaceae bacterium]|nr:DUF4143 domain-containing protein [Propionibacteriaceae bacterium]
MNGFIRRPLADWLLRQGTAPVLIVEGARAVGKTTMARRQLERDGGYHYATLADQATWRRAAADPAAWLRSLPLPSVIDEAQLLPELPLVLKEHVDQLGAGQHFVLTGSASINRKGLGGSDPLARRAQRRVMHPLTRRELAAVPGSLVDDLFEAEPVLGRTEQAADAELLDQLRTGGLPPYATRRPALTKAQLRDRVSSDLTGLLADQVVPGLDYNVPKARAALDALLCGPGGIFNASALAGRLEINKATVERYLGVFGRLFLLQWLPNLATPPRRQDFARAKVHPFDTSFAVDALERAGVDVLAQREFFGQVLESHVVAEVVAAAGWAESAVLPYYWRRASSTSPEVDLVLLDQSGRAVAIEVKASSSVDQWDLRGIRAFGRDRTLHRGFVFYRGDEALRLDADVWALPFSALERATAFARASPDAA